MSNLNSPERVTVTIPEDVKDLFVWMKKYEPSFEGKDATIGAFLLKLGAEAYYKQGLENIVPLESEIVEAFDKSSLQAISEIMDEPVLTKVK